MKDILEYLFSYNTLRKEEAKSIMLQIPSGTFNDFEITSFMSVFMMRSITIEELRGFTEALKQKAVAVDLGTTDLVDIVGTGGDGKNTFNISTLACFVVAGAGQKVAKHGNVGASSISGSSNVMQHLGVQFYQDSEKLRAQLEASNLCFLHAPLFHPSLKSVAPMRKQLGFRTFFNMLGPLVNPANPDHATLGVYNMETARLYNYYLQQEKEHFTVVHSLDGYDEISLTGESLLMDENGTHLHSPSEFGVKTIKPEELYGGNTQEEAATLFRNILEGKGTEAQNNVVITNAAIALQTTQKFGDFTDCFKLADQSLKQGSALECLNKLIAV
ncbi:MAG: anthranilate phosphoribosyltransferase [Weeksellaceae bacterium]